MSILELEKITKSFDGICAVDQVSLDFGSGKITALIGPNGAGKTTVFNLISGFVRPDQGKIFYGGENISGYPPWHVAQLGIGRLFQDIKLFGKMNLIENVMTAFRTQQGENALLAVIARWKVIKQERQLLKKAMNLLDFVGLVSKSLDPAESLSYGQQKLLSIARLLAMDAKVFLLDEPTAGVSPRMVAVLLDIIRKLALQEKTVVVIEHNMNVVLEVANWVYFMNEGQVTSFGLPHEVLCDPEVRRAYMGI
jgi:ABC-type branched-subunit amino acid transport system ATPase component